MFFTFQKKKLKMLDLLFIVTDRFRFVEPLWNLAKTLTEIVNKIVTVERQNNNKNVGWRDALNGRCFLDFSNFEVLAFVEAYWKYQSRVVAALLTPTLFHWQRYKITGLDAALRIVVKISNMWWPACVTVASESLSLYALSLSLSLERERESFHENENQTKSPMKIFHIYTSVS